LLNIRTILKLIDFYFFNFTRNTLSFLHEFLLLHQQTTLIVTCSYCISSLFHTFSVFFISSIFVKYYMKETVLAEIQEGG